MGLWDWIVMFHADAEVRGDRQRVRLPQLFENARRFIKTNPDVMLGLLAEGRALALQLDEPWWVLFFDHWRLQTLLHYKLDYRDVLDIAVQATLEARKPQYAQLPQRICLHEDLINAYVGIDAEGHAERIEQALDYMEQEVRPGLECRYCLQGCRTQLFKEQQRLDEARDAALRQLEMTDAEANRSIADYHAVEACSDLCVLAHARRDWDSLREWAAAGEETAQRRDRLMELGRFLAWQALLARQDGQEEKARRLYRGAVLRVQGVKAVPAESYFDALSAYHEQGGKLEEALRVRDGELARIGGKGRLAHETRCRLHRCRLLARLGRLSPDDVAATRAAAGRLRYPERYLAELDRIAGT